MAGTFAPYGTFRQFGLSLRVEVEMLLVCIQEVGTGMLPHLPRCTGRPCNKEFSRPKCQEFSRLRNPALGPQNLAWQKVGVGLGGWVKR